ncbi:MAG: enoyl-CoA hydratase/isomerase family protein [Proteobacteria bacterium]|nr:enoyl-CoA hydratase/isomerase family protein [Pseudomonadota bacterium]
MSDWISVTHDGPIATLTLDRQARRNAMNSAVWTDLRDVAHGLAASPPRVLIVTGAGGHFSSGMDLSADNPLLMRLLPLIQKRDEQGLTQLIAELQETMNAYADFPVPVIAAVEGACAGSGLEWALSCDLIVAAEGAFFSLPETRHGMVPDVGGTTRLTRRVGQARASDLILTGRNLSLDEAETWGLVDRRVPEGTALKAATELAKQICLSAPTATEQALTVLKDLENNDPSLARERAAGTRALISGEVLEGFAAFGEKRAPKWAAQ